MNIQEQTKKIISQNLHKTRFEYYCNLFENMSNEDFEKRIEKYCKNLENIPDNHLFPIVELDDQSMILLIITKIMENRWLSYKAQLQHLESKFNNAQRNYEKYESKDTRYYFKKSQYDFNSVKDRMNKLSQQKYKVFTHLENDIRQNLNLPKKQKLLFYGKNIYLPNVLTINMGPVKPSGSTTVDDAIKNGHYAGKYIYLENEVNANIFKNWPNDLPEREIFIGLVPIGKVIRQGGVQKYWAEGGYEIPQYADAYLHQLMCNVPEAEMPKELQGKCLVAYTDTPNFRYEHGGGCILCVSFGDFGRGLSVTFGSDVWSDRWGFVLCKKTSETET